jgi:hypothetical protein
MSPEQCHGESLDERSDVYGCGALFYELVTGEAPFSGDDALSVMRQHLLFPPELPSARCADVGPAADDLAMKALAKDPNARFANMREMRRAFRDLVGRPASSPSWTSLPSDADESGSHPIATSDFPKVRAPMSSEIRELAPPVAAAEDAEKRALADILQTGDADEIASRVIRLLPRLDAASLRALALLDDPAKLMPLAEALLADFVLPTPYIEQMLHRAGLAAARALLAARVRRPSTHTRRMRFVSWMRVIGRPSYDVLHAALSRVPDRSPSIGRLDCAEDLLLSLPRPLDGRLEAVVEPYLRSVAPRLRELAALALADGA